MRVWINAVNLMLLLYPKRKKKNKTKQNLEYYQGHCEELGGGSEALVWQVRGGYVE